MRRLATVKLSIGMLSACLASGTLSADVIVAGWDGVANTSTTNQIASQIEAEGVSGAWIWGDGGEWAHQGNSGSQDQTFGTVSGARKSVGVATGALRAGGSSVKVLDFVLSNEGGVSYVLTGFHFDAWATHDSSNTNWELQNVGAAMVLSSGTLVSKAGVNPPAGEADYDDIDIVLNGISLNSGESLTFRLTFSGGFGASAYTYIDNVAVTAIPEPSTVGLFTISAAGCLLLRR